MAEIAAGLVQVTGPRRILVVAPGIIVSPEEARQMAANLQQAADASEKTSPILLPRGLLPV